MGDYEYISNFSASASKRPPVSAAKHADFAMLLARGVRRRREELGLSIERAAQLSGMELSDWYALEAGWVPSQDSGLVEAIAGTLESGYIQTSLIAEISRYNQKLLFNSLPSLASKILREAAEPGGHKGVSPAPLQVQENKHPERRLELATNLWFCEHRWAERSSNSTYAAKRTETSLRAATLVASFEGLKWSLKSFDNEERN